MELIEQGAVWTCNLLLVMNLTAFFCTTAILLMLDVAVQLVVMTVKYDTVDVNVYV